MSWTSTTNYGADYGADAQVDGIYAYINGGDYPQVEQDLLVDALLDALRDEVDARLPDGVTWQPATAEFLHPVDVDVPDADEMREIFADAWAAVASRYEEIERDALYGSLPATVEELEQALKAIGSPLHRARVAGLLTEAGTRAMASRVRAEAVYAATRERGSIAAVAETLGTGVSALRTLITEHKRRSGIS